MAEEVKKIITVEVGKSITSVRDFKKHIEDLRGALLGLNEESDEYKTIAEQIATDQAKLNDVMKVGKTNTDSAAGSYNELNNQLKALRNQYKALSETERNSTTGQSILQNITKLDDELKDIDASMGQYQRNVGNYKGAFEEAFKAVARDIGNINPKIGSLMSTASSLIPLIKKATTAATTGLKGVKAAIASTGIGLLVVALGEIVAHWEEIYGWIQKVLGKQQDLTTETQKTARAVGEISQAVSEYYRNMGELLSAKGLDTKQVNTTLQEVNRTEQGVNDARITQLEAWKRIFQGIQSNFDKASKSIFGGTKMWDSVYQFNEQVENFNQSIEDFDEIFTQGLSEEEHAAEVREKSLKSIEQMNLASAGKPIDEAVEKLDKYISDYKERARDLKNIQKDLRNEQEKIDAQHQTSAINRANEAANVFKTEEQLRKEQYDKDVADAKKYITDETNLKNALINLEAEYREDIRKIRENAWKSSDAYKEREERLSQAKSLYKSLLDYGKDEVQLVMEKYEEELVLLQQFGYDTTNLTNKYLDDIQKAIQNKSDDIDSLIQQIADEIKKTWEDAFKLDLQKINDEETAALHQADMMWTINPNTHESDIQLEREKEDRIYEIQKEGYYKRIQLYEEHLLLLEQGSDEYLDLERQITEAKMDLDDLGYNHAVELEERKRQDIQLTIDKVNEAVRIAQGSIQFYGAIANEIASYTLETAKEGTAEYKAAQITQTIVSTLSGMVGSFSQAMSLYGPTPWGFALGAAGATAMGIIGALRVNQIKNANGNSSIGSSSAGASAPGVGVEPLLNQDYDLQRITNLSLQSDAYLPGNTQVYVLESDIQEVGRRVEVREQNATF